MQSTSPAQDDCFSDSTRTYANVGTPKLPWIIETLHSMPKHKHGQRFAESCSLAGSTKLFRVSDHAKVKSSASASITCNIPETALQFLPESARKQAHAQGVAILHCSKLRPNEYGALLNITEDCFFTPGNTAH